MSTLRRGLAPAIVEGSNGEKPDMRTYVEPSPRPLRPRQDRLEAAIGAVLRTGGTRSELRPLVDQLADLFRMQGISLKRPLDTIRALGSRARPVRNDAEPAVSASPSKRLSLMERWGGERFNRGD